MKTLITKFLFLSIAIFTLSCSSDNGTSSYPESLDGSTWQRHQTTFQSGQTIETDFYMIFQNTTSGNLKAVSLVSGTNITQNFYFTYVYSQGRGTAVFEDANIGSQAYTISGNKLVLDGETLTKQ